MTSTVKESPRKNPHGVDFGHRTLTFRPFGDKNSLRIGLRPLIVTTALIVLSAAISVIALGLGKIEVSPTEVISALLGGSDSATRMVVIDWRLPRIVLALVCGAALGLSGAVFQSLTRNPLGSPDIIGFNTGAYSGALVAILLLGGSALSVATGAIIGGLATALLVYLLAWRKGVQGFRLIIVGIAISAMLASVNTWMILKAELSKAMAAAVWGAGSLNGLGWTQVIAVGLCLAVIVPALCLLGRQLSLMEMGDDAAQALGVRTEPSRVALVVIGVVLTAVVTATAGPIAFVSLAAPQLARKLARGNSIALFPSAVMGSFLLAASDVIAQHTFPGISLPVGVITVSLGGGYLLWLLAAETKRR